MNDLICFFSSYTDTLPITKLAIYFKREFLLYSPFYVHWCTEGEIYFFLDRKCDHILYINNNFIFMFISLILIEAFIFFIHSLLVFFLSIICLSVRVFIFNGKGFIIPWFSYLFKGNILWLQYFSLSSYAFRKQIVI